MVWATTLALVGQLGISRQVETSTIAWIRPEDKDGGPF